MNQNQEEIEYNPDNFPKRFGMYGKFILMAGKGGGFYSVPEAIDIYQSALGLTIKEAWFLKILFRYLPNIQPTMKRISKETGVREAELSAIKKSLIKKGFICDNGPVDKTKGKMQRNLNIMPLFLATAICIACDSKSNVAKKQAINNARLIYSEEIGRPWPTNNSNEMEFPMPIEMAQQFAKQQGFSLNWNRIAELQNTKALEEIEAIKFDKLRILRMKDAISAGIKGRFNFIYFGRTYKWLKQLCSTPIEFEEVMNITEDYFKKTNKPNSTEYMNFMNSTINLPRNQKILNDRKRTK